MTLLVLFVVVPLIIVSAIGLMQLFLFPLFVEFKTRPPRATQYYLSDGLLFFLTFGGLSSVLFAIVDERSALAVLLGFLLVLLGLLWTMGCHFLSRLNIKDFWPRAAGLTCVSAAMASAVGLAISFLPVLITLPKSAKPFLVWCAGFLVALTICRLGAAYTLQQARDPEAP